MLADVGCVQKAWVFGSFASNKITEESDVDILLEFTPINNIDIMDMAVIQANLSEVLGRNVDIMDLAHLDSEGSEELKRQIHANQVLVFPQ